MNDLLSPTDNYTRLAGYSLWLCIFGTCSYLLTFPAGIYYGFLFSAIGSAAAILSRPYAEKKRRATAAIILGAINIVICLLAFHGLDTLYTSLKDPELGPVITDYVLSMLDQYGVSTETFVSIMHP